MKHKLEAVPDPAEGGRLEWDARDGMHGGEVGEAATGEIMRDQGRSGEITGDGVQGGK